MNFVDLLTVTRSEQRIFHSRSTQDFYIVLSGHGATVMFSD